MSNHKAIPNLRRAQGIILQSLDDVDSETGFRLLDLVKEIGYVIDLIMDEKTT